MAKHRAGHSFLRQALVTLALIGGAWLAYQVLSRWFL